jgi:hypothetical protein
MIAGSEWLLDVSRAVLADRQQSIGKARALLTANASEAFTDRNRNGRRPALAGELCKLLYESMCFSIFDIQTHRQAFQSMDCNRCTTRRQAPSSARRGDIDEAQLDALLPVPPVDGERARRMHGAAAMGEKRGAELLARGAERDGVDG